ncbi:MAG: hypothetical protein WAW79_07690 [Steroidobacteraceae bacterium]
MTPRLCKSNAHFRPAVTRLLPGVSSNFRYLGDDKTYHVASGHGARLTDIDGPGRRRLHFLPSVGSRAARRAA